MNHRISLNTEYVKPSLIQGAEALEASAMQKLHSIAERSCIGSEWTGWYHYPEREGFQQVQEISDFVDQIQPDYDLVLVIGIGGSYLGTRAADEALFGDLNFENSATTAQRRAKIFYAGHNLSESYLTSLLATMERFKPLVNVVSKSGTTTEPGVVFRLVRRYMEERFGQAEASQRIIATTDANKGALRSLAKEKGYRCFVVPDDIGGRYSVLTPVGQLPLALAGHDVAAMQKGAHEVFVELDQVRQSHSKHPVIDYACIRQAAFACGAQIEVSAITEPRLASVLEWWKQLFGESEGKKGRGLFPASVVYTTDLHSMGQYMQEGPRNILETFVSFAAASNNDAPLKVAMLDDDADQLNYLAGKSISEINHKAMMATIMAHFSGGLDCLQIKAPAMSASSIGSLFAFYETSCAVSGLLLGVNPFDQPGVEAYKENMFRLLGRPGFA